MKVALLRRCPLCRARGCSPTHSCKHFCLSAWGRALKYATPKYTGLWKCRNRTTTVEELEWFMFSLSVCSGNLGFAHSAESFYLRHSQESCNHGMKRTAFRFFVVLGATMFPSKSIAPCARKLRKMFGLRKDAFEAAHETHQKKYGFYD